MSRPLKIHAGVLLLLVATLTGRAEWKVGDELPALDPRELAGGRLPATAGQVVLVDFWASWCAPCKASFPAFARLQQDYGARGLAIVGVSVDESPAAFAGFVKKMAPTFPVVHDQHQQLVRAAKVPTMPTSYLFDRAGRLRFIHRGFFGKTTEAELRREIESLLQEKSSHP